MPSVPFANQGKPRVPLELRMDMWDLMEKHLDESGIDLLPEKVTGLAEWAFDPAAGPFNAATSQGTGRIIVVKVPVRRPRSIRNIHVRVQTGGATLTAGQNLAGLYLPSGAKIANSETADQSGNWVNAQLHSMALAGGVIALDPGASKWVWVALLTVGTTPPLFRRSVLSPHGNDGCVAAEKRFALDASTGNTTLPANLTPGTMADFDGVWAALS